MQTILYANFLSSYKNNFMNKYTISQQNECIITISLQVELEINSKSKIFMSRGMIEN